MNDFVSVTVLNDDGNPQTAYFRKSSIFAFAIASVGEHVGKVCLTFAEEIETGVPIEDTLHEFIERLG